MKDVNECRHGEGDRHDCGHTDAEHAEMHELGDLLHRVQTIENPRVALIVSEAGEIHFASSIPPGEAAEALIEMAYKIKRYGGNYMREHFERGRRAHLN